jgi:hypothetical protein
VSTWKRSQAIRPFDCAAGNSAQVGPDRRDDGSTPWRFKIAQRLEGTMTTRPWRRARRGPPVAPGRVLLRQSEDERGSSLGDGRSTWPAVRAGPVVGDEVPVPTQQGCRLNEEVPETLAGEQSCESRRTVHGRWMTSSVPTRWPHARSAQFATACVVSVSAAHGITDRSQDPTNVVGQAGSRIVDPLGSNLSSPPLRWR